MAYRGESASKMFRKMRDGTMSDVNGKGRMIVFVGQADRDPVHRARSAASAAQPSRQAPAGEAAKDHQQPAAE